MPRPPRRIALEVAVVIDGRQHQEIARLAGISPHAFSMLLRGVSQSTPQTRARIAEVLGVPERQIFPEFYAHDLNLGSPCDAIAAELIEAEA